MRFELAQLARRAGPSRRRKVVVLRDIIPPATLATSLYLATYARVVQHWSAAIPRIMAEYERTVASMTTDSPADVQAEVDAAENGFLRLLLEIAPELTDWAIRVERWHRSKWRGAVLSATGVDLQTLIGPEEVRDTVEAVIARNVALVKDVSAQAQSRISDAVFRGLTQRTPPREVAAQLREAVAMSKRRSVAIASDQLTKITSSLAEERMREAGIDVYEWVHSRKARPREDHAGRNGKLYSASKAMIGRTIEGKTVAREPEDKVGQLPYCGCRALPVMVFD